MDQDCVDATIMSDALRQDTKTLSREFEAKMFSCSSSQNPFTCDEEDHTGTFSKSWYDQERLTTCEMVDVGFYCIGSDDRVYCFYCDKRLFC